jgi:DNA-binding NarL/FixJ family response regulator
MLEGVIGGRLPAHVTRPRILLADDHTLLLEAFEKLLADDCDVVGAVSNGQALLEAAATLSPDVAIVDIAMPLMNGLDAARQLKTLHPDIRVLVLTMNEDPDLAVEALRAGASGYVLKSSAAVELLTAIREVMEGRSYVTPRFGEDVANAAAEKEDKRKAQGLTPRQRQIVQLIAEGHSMKEVAAILNITPRTVAFHKYRLMEQLQFKSTAELIQYAVKRQLV